MVDDEMIGDGSERFEQYINHLINLPSCPFSNIFVTIFKYVLVYEM